MDYDFVGELTAIQVKFVRDIYKLADEKGMDRKKLLGDCLATIDILEVHPMRPIDFKPDSFGDVIPFPPNKIYKN